LEAASKKGQVECVEITDWGVPSTKKNCRFWKHHLRAK